MESYEANRNVELKTKCHLASAPNLQGFQNLEGFKVAAPLKSSTQNEVTTSKAHL